MANPFKEAEKAKKKAPGSKQETVKTEETVVVPPVVEEKPAETVVAPVKEEKTRPAKKEPVAPSKPVSALFSSLNIEKSAAKTHAFYLSDENVEKLKKLAKQKGVSTSKLLDHILSEIL